VTDGPERTGSRVVLVGRPNAGKSALFNLLTKSRRALVHARPGMTRDALEGVAETAGGKHYLVYDTGGLDLDAVGGFAAWTRERALTTVADADLLLLVVDGTAGLLPEDRRVAARLRELGKPVILVWNKVDVSVARDAESEAHALGFDPVVAVSALHGTGLTELDDAIEARLPRDLQEEVAGGAPALSLAIVGRPNVGKSSLVNALFGQDRVMVSEIPGTTRDPIDVALERDGRRYLLVDTAGIRRKGKTDDPAEKLSVIAARKSAERARLVAVVFDAFEGVTSQDMTIAGYANEAGRGLLLLANKWDLIETDRQRGNALRDTVRDRFGFTKGAPFLPVSAKTGRGVGKILAAADGLAARFVTKLGTGELNRVLQRAFEAQEPRGRSGRNLRIRYAVQVSSAPPTIRLFADREEGLHFAFERYLQNRLREKWPLDGVPIRFSVRKSE